MLRDATLETFLDLARRGRILRSFNRSEMRAELSGNRTVLFRSADNPDRLRGPNLGWFWIDEAAMVLPLAFQILLGRLRLDPGEAWGTTTPRGKNWVWKVLAQKALAGDPRFKLVRASSRSNPFLPADFVPTLLEAYDHDFAQQEIEGEFLDETLGRLISDWWIDRLPLLVRPSKAAGPRWMTVDLGEGGGAGDASAVMVGDSLGILYAMQTPFAGPARMATWVRDLTVFYDVRQDRTVYDRGGGRGLDIAPYLEQVGITEAIPYKGSKSGGPKFANKRARMGWRLRQRLDPERPRPVPELKFDASKHAAREQAKRSVFYVPPTVEPFVIQDPFCLPVDRPWWPLLREELEALYYFHKGKTIALENKDEMKARLGGRSPNLVDCLLMSRSLYPDGEDE